MVDGIMVKLCVNAPTDTIDSFFFIQSYQKRKKVFKRIWHDVETTWLTFSRASFVEDWIKIWLARAVDVFVSLWASILLLLLSLLLLLQYKPLSFLLLLFDNDDNIDGEQPITIAPFNPVWFSVACYFLK